MPSDDYVPSADDPLGGPPVLLRNSTFDRHARAVEIVEGGNNARYPRSPRGRTTHPSKGTWGHLASGHTITAASGLTLGSGTVQLCSRSGETLTADGDDVVVLNSGGVITGPKSLELDWTDGAWAVCVCGGCAIHVLACNPANSLVGASVTIKDSGGTVLDSGTTDSSGNLTTTGGCGSNRTIVVTAPGYVTATFTGQTLTSGATLSLNMSGSLDTTNYVCCNCAVPKTVHYSFSDIHNGVSHSGSGTATYVGAGTNVWHVALGDLVCFAGHLVLSINYDNADGGTVICHMEPTALTCDPFSITFGLPTDPPCDNFAASTGYTAFSMTITA